MNAPARSPSAPSAPARVTRIARRRARPGREAEYEVMLREMLAKMRAFKGFLGGVPGVNYLGRSTSIILAGGSEA